MLSDDCQPNRTYVDTFSNAGALSENGTCPNIDATVPKGTWNSIIRQSITHSTEDAAIPKGTWNSTIVQSTTPSSEVMPVLPEWANAAVVPAIVASKVFGIGIAVAVVGITSYTGYHICKGFRAGLRGKELLRYPFIRQNKEQQQTAANPASEEESLNLTRANPDVVPRNTDGLLASNV